MINQCSQIIILFLVSYRDYCDGEVANAYWLLLLGLMLLNEFNGYKLILLIVLYLILCQIYHYIESYIGGADLKLLLLILYDGFLKVLIVANLACLMGLIYMLVKRKYQIRFIPFISLAYVMVLIC